MPDLDNFFKLDEANFSYDSHPLVRKHIEISKNPRFHQARIRINRPRAVFGYESAMLELLHFDNKNQEYDSISDEWDFDLNAALIQREIRSIDEKNEIERFGLNLNFALRHVETRFGDGFFNAVLMKVVQDSPLARQQPLVELFPHIKTLQPYGNEESISDCTLMVQEVLQDQWLYLRRKLEYDPPASESILAGAMAYYLDERFGITDGKKLGWLKS